jgi:phosphatidylethanolamine/phosphatidyl-N-methylethanolamine N-methyltransferase
MAAHDVLLFFRALACSPRSVGAIAPSGANLASLITSEITAASGPVLELGPGTGVFTEALLERGVRESDLTLIEYGSDFMRLLQARFPKARVLWMDAAWMASYDLFEQPLGAVVSGLPLLNSREESHGHPHRRLQQTARQRIILSIHLWRAVPGIEVASR